MSLKSLILFPALVANVFYCFGGIRYVKENNSGNGSSWQNASGDIQQQIEAAAPGDSLFVAGGIYKPLRPGDNPGMVDINIGYEESNAFTS